MDSHPYVIPCVVLQQCGLVIQCGVRGWLAALSQLRTCDFRMPDQRTAGKGKVVYGQEPPSGESTTTECVFNYQLLAVITEVAQWGAPSCSQPQPATDNGVREGRSNWLVAPPTLHRAVLPELHVLHTAMRAANHKTCCTESAANLRLQNARPTHCRCSHSGYDQFW